MQHMNKCTDPGPDLDHLSMQSLSGLDTAMRQQNGSVEVDMDQCFPLVTHRNTQQLLTVTFNHHHHQ